ncbi:MAG TPA: hypothetical protein VHV47_06195 [Opitutaceae bacterium]|jgi:hypothetical protein|nr:hypothetical protein [Opitutaceae bacterium]
MNRTLLLIIVDFLFLNLIALTRWDRTEPTRVTQPPVTEVGANSTVRNDDLADAMKQSLTDEQAQRETLEQKLAYANSTLAQREQNVSSLQAQQGKLAGNLAQVQRSAAELQQRVNSSTEEASLTRDQLSELRRELEEKNAEAERQRQALAGLQAQQSEQTKKMQGLVMALAVGETEKQDLQRQTQQLQTQVQSERAERAQVEQQSTQLAQGVGQLAQKSGELTQEIRDNRPVNPNTLFDQFMANQVDTTFSASHRGFGLFDRNPTKSMPTVFVTDGKQVYALAHVADTPFSFTDTGTSWENVGVAFNRESTGYHGSAGEVDFLAADPRAIVIPVDSAQVSGMGVKVYGLATDPFKFPEAVLVSARGKGYGALGFKLDPAHPGYVRVDNHLFRKLFGDFSPSRGDLVFSQSGDLLGIMVNSNYCLILKDFTAGEIIHAGPGAGSPPTTTVLASVGARMLAQPLDLQ